MGGHRSRNQSCSKFRKDSKSGDFPPRGGGGPRPQNQICGKFSETRRSTNKTCLRGREVPEKLEKLQGLKFAYMTARDLENLQVNLATTSSGALKLAENANIENVSTPTLNSFRAGLRHWGAHAKGSWGPLLLSSALPGPSLSPPSLPFPSLPSPLLPYLSPPLPSSPLEVGSLNIS